MPLSENYQYYTQPRQLAPAPNEWSQILHENVNEAVPRNNVITVDYALIGTNLVDSEFPVFNTGQVTVEYSQDTVTHPRIVNAYETGDYHNTTWAIDLGRDPVNPQILHLIVSTDQVDVRVYYNVTSQSPVSHVYDQNDWAYVIPTSPGNPVYAEIVHSLENGWALNQRGDIYNDNLTGRVGINTGSKELTKGVLEVIGKQFLEGGLTIAAPRTVGVELTSDKASGTGFEIRDSELDRSLFYIDENGQIGINTNTPTAGLHNIGTTTLAGHVLIGDGNVSRARLDLTSTGDDDKTYALKLHDKNNQVLFSVRDDGEITGMGGLGDPVVVFEAIEPDTLHLGLKSGTDWYLDHVAILDSNKKIHPDQLPDNIGGSSMWEDAELGVIQPKTVGEGLRPYVDLGRGWRLGTSDNVTSFGQLADADWTDDNQVVSAKAIKEGKLYELNDLKDVTTGSSHYQGIFGTGTSFSIFRDEGNVAYLFPVNSKVIITSASNSPVERTVAGAIFNPATFTTELTLDVGGVGEAIVTSTIGSPNDSFLSHTAGQWTSADVRLGANVKDVNLVRPSAGQLLTYDGYFWTNTNEQYLSKTHDDRAEGSIGIKVDPDPAIALKVGGSIQLQKGNTAHYIKSSAADVRAAPDPDSEAEAEHTLLTQSAIWPHIEKK